MEGKIPTPNPGITTGPERETRGGTPVAEGKKEAEGAESGEARLGGGGGRGTEEEEAEGIAYPGKGAKKATDGKQKSEGAK